MTDRDMIVDLLCQVIEGEDYRSLDRLIDDLDPMDACDRPEGAPYSIATIAWHTWFWCNLWNEGICGGENPTLGWDLDATWPEIGRGEWDKVRGDLYTALRRAALLAEEADLDQVVWDDQTASHLLMEIAVHSAYHIGQIALTRQVAGLWVDQQQ